MPWQDDVSSGRMTILNDICAFTAGLRGEPVVTIAIDGVDGVGKTTFADQLGQALTTRGRSVIRASVDSFHNPRAVRYRRGRASPEGFYRDSYNYDALRENLLDPLSRGGSLRYRTAVFDCNADRVVASDWLTAPDNSILILDGLFLHRRELREYWNFSVFLDAPFEVTVPRGAARGEGFGDPDPLASSNERYVTGNKIYFHEAQPKSHATVLINLTELARPTILSWRK